MAHTWECERSVTILAIRADMKLTTDEIRAMTSPTMQVGIACNCLMGDRRKDAGQLRVDTRRWVFGCRKHREGGVVGAVAASSFFGAGRLKLGVPAEDRQVDEAREEESGTVIHVDFEKRARRMTPIDLPADREDD